MDKMDQDPDVTLSIRGLLYPPFVEELMNRCKALEQRCDALEQQVKILTLRSRGELYEGD